MLGISQQSANKVRHDDAKTQFTPGRVVGCVILTVKPDFDRTPEGFLLPC